MKDEASPLGLFERYLSVWVLLAILAGLGLGLVAPDAVGVLAGLEYASVNLVVAVLIWAMIFPMMVGVDFGSIRDIGRKPKGLVITLVINWLIKPFTMAALAVLFFDYLYADMLPRADAGIHRRPDPAGRGPLHRHGVRVVADDPRRSGLHAGAGVGERSGDDRGLRAAGRAAAGRD